MSKVKQIDDKKMNRKKTGIRSLLCIIIVLWMCVIFGFSADNGDESEAVSNPIVIKVIQMIHPDYDTLSPNMQEKYFYRISLIVRKIAHFSEYAILGMLIIALLLTFEQIKKLKKSAIFMEAVGGGFCLAYAITDELHQWFVPGRETHTTDVLIDTLGGVFGSAIILMIWKCVTKKKDKNAKKVEDKK